MELNEVDFKNKQELSQIEELYMEAFPKDERAPFRMLVRRARQGRAQMLRLTQDGKWCGMMYLVRHRDLVYVFYFAVCPEQRGQGLGTLAIRELLRRCREQRVFLALEDWTEDCPNREQRLHRHQFYRNCGLTDLPCRIKEANVVFHVMGNHGVVEPEEYQALMNRYLGFLWRHTVDVRMLTDNEKGSGKNEQEGQ